MGVFHVVLLFLGCECEDRPGMLSQSPRFVLTIFNITNEQEGALGNPKKGKMREGGTVNS